jgi:hypothetical protein
MSTIIITGELLQTLGATNEVIEACERFSLWGTTFAHAKKVLTENNVEEEITYWMTNITTTEIFVRTTGSEFIMNTRWRVFNPLIGQTETFDDQQQAEARLVEIAAEVLVNNTPRMTTELINENGDSTWITSDMHTRLSAIIK